MEPGQTAPRSPHLETAHRLLADKGHDLGFFRMRVAAGKSGVAVGFPQDPMVHISWSVLVALGMLVAAIRARTTIRAAVSVCSLWATIHSSRLIRPGPCAWIGENEER